VLSGERLESIDRINEFAHFKAFGDAVNVGHGFVSQRYRTSVRHLQSGSPTSTNAAQKCGCS
jgi:hypothetical protein